jgi:hypothetical protein
LNQLSTQKITPIYFGFSKTSLIGSLIVLSLLISVFLLGFLSSSVAQAQEDIPDNGITDGVQNPDGQSRQRMRPGRPNRRGNEDSQRPNRIPRFDRPVKERGNAEREGAFDGCPDGSVSVTFSPDGLAFTVIFDKFIAQTSAASSQRAARVACHLRVPMTLPENQQMTITNLDYRGFVSLPAQSAAAMRAGYAFERRRPGGPGGGGPLDGAPLPRRPGDGRGGFNGFGGFGSLREWRDFLNGGLMVNFIFKIRSGREPVSQEFLLSSQDVVNNKAAISPCGGNTKLRLNTMLMLRLKQPSDSYIALDSMDGTVTPGGSTAITYFVRYDACKN